jgi:hypothetical protein
MKNIENLYRNYNFCKPYLTKSKCERIEKVLRYCEDARFMTFEEASAIIEKIVRE